MDVITGKEARMYHHSHTSKTPNRPRIAVAVLALAAIAAAAPAVAQARHAPGDIVTQQPRLHYSSARLNQLDALGPKYVTVHPPATPVSSTTPSPGSRRGFDWRDTGVGLGAVAFALALAAAAVMLARRRRSEPQPEQSSLSGA
jgi:hypothetical protein